MSSLAYLSAVELAAMIKAREITSVELTRLYIDRIEKYDGDINAVIIRTFDDALAKAELADRALNEGRELGPLHGVPMTIKESYVIADTAST